MAVIYLFIQQTHEILLDTKNWDPPKNEQEVSLVSQPGREEY